MANILLINADLEAQALPPLGLCYIAETLISNKHNVSILDWGHNKNLNLKKLDFIGISATSLTYLTACNIIKKIKNINNKIPIIIGGVHASVMPDYVLKTSNADAVVIGEGEKIMLQIANKEIKPKGIIKAPLIENIDKIPYPKFKYIDFNYYFNLKKMNRIRWTLPFPSLPIIATRGCPFNCKFCASKNLYGKKIRMRSIENIEKEIKYLQKNLNIKGIYFYDDTLTYNKKWIIKLCAKLKKLNIKWICGTRVDMVDLKLLKIMKKSGCKYISYGIESGSNRILKNIINKGITKKQIFKAISDTKKAKIGIIVNFMFGIPGETENDLQQTYKLVKNLPSSVAILNLFVPLPGAELGNDKDWINYKQGDDSYNSSIKSDKLSILAKKYHKKAFFAYFFSFRFLFNNLKMFFYPKQLFYGFINYLKLLKKNVFFL